MSTKIGIGFSEHPNPEVAAKEAAFLAKTNLNEDTIDLAIVFSTTHYFPQRTLPVLTKILNTNHIIGSSAAGVILSDTIKTKGIGVLTLKSYEMEFGIGSVNHLKDQDSFQAGSQLAKNSLSGYGSQGGRQAFLYFADTKVANYTQFLKGIQSILGNVFPIIGAGSSDNFRFQETFQFYQNEILNNSAVGLVIGGHASIGLGSRHGWRPLGKPRFVDKSDYNVIKMIDGRKASDIYREFLGKEADKFLSNQLSALSLFYPLGVYVEGGQEYLLKNTLGVLPDGSLVSQGHVPVGSRIHLMIGNKDSCRQATIEAAHEAQRNLNGKQPQFILVIESMTRLKLLSRSASNELKKIKEIFGPEVPIMGMYSNGEVSPYQTVERFKSPLLQNESIMIVAVA